MKKEFPHVHIRKAGGTGAEKAQKRAEPITASLPGGHYLWIGGDTCILTISGQQTLVALAEMILTEERGVGYWQTGKP